MGAQRRTGIGRATSLYALALVVPAVVALAVVALAAAPAHATEIPIPDRGPGASTADASGARDSLAAWLGQPEGRTVPFVSALADALTRSAPPIVSLDAATGELLIHDPSPFAATLPGARFTAIAAVRDDAETAFAITVDTFAPTAQSGPALGALRVTGTASRTRFDLVAADRNPIRLAGNFGDEIVAQVVYVPEPGTLALFAAGLTGLVGLVLRRRRRRARAT